MFLILIYLVSLLDPVRSTCEAPAQDITYMVNYYDEHDQEALLHESGRDYVIVGAENRRRYPARRRYQAVPNTRKITRSEEEKPIETIIC